LPTAAHRCVPQRRNSRKSANISGLIPSFPFLPSCGNLRTDSHPSRLTPHSTLPLFHHSTFPAFHPPRRAIPENADPVRRQTTFVAPYIVKGNVANRDRPGPLKTAPTNMNDQAPGLRLRNQDSKFKIQKSGRCLPSDEVCRTIHNEGQRRQPRPARKIESCQSQRTIFEKKRSCHRSGRPCRPIHSEGHCRQSRPADRTERCTT
jgi:hypothetical protein